MTSSAYLHDLIGDGAQLLGAHAHVRLLSRFGSRRRRDELSSPGAHGHGGPLVGRDAPQIDLGTRVVGRVERSIDCEQIEKSGNSSSLWPDF